MSTTREQYLVAEHAGMSCGVQMQAGDEPRKMMLAIRRLLAAGGLPLQIEERVRLRWPDRAFWLEIGIKGGGYYQLVEYGAFTNKPHKRAG